MSIIRSKLLDGIHAKSTPFTPTPEIPASSVQAAMQYLIEHMLIGTTVQAWDANLDQIAALTPTDGNVIVGDGSAWVAESGNTARTSLGLGTGDSPTFTAVTVGNTGLTVGSSSPFSDSSGTLTLQNIDALDATTESTIEASIDTLANLTSIQGVGFTFGAYAPTLLNTANEAGFKAAVNLEIGVDVQAYDADLTTWAGLTPSANAQSLVTAANYASMRALLDLEAGTDFYSIPATDSAISTAVGALSSVYQPLDSDLTSLAGLGSAADKVAYTTGAHAWAETALTSFGRSLIDDADAATARSTLGLVIGTNVQAYDAELAALAGLTSAADSLPYFTGSGTASLATFTSAARNLLDDSDATTMRTTLGLGSLSTLSSINGSNWSGQDLALADGGTGASLSDPNADRVMFWDDSASAVTWLTATTGLEISNTDLRMTSNQRTGCITYIIDGGGATITTGIKGDFRVPASCTISGVTAMADQTGSIVVDIWKDTYANFPPTDADSITSAAPVTISSSTKSEDTSLSGWTTSVSAGDILRFNVDSVTSIQRLTIELRVAKT